MRVRTRAITAGALALAALWAAPASAQATRTWVSGVGDDANPCSRTAPCKTFAGAISKTAGGGEINCLDPGGFGAVTITKAISIFCVEGQGSILASNTNGVIINADTAARVLLSGLDINGAGTGINGVRVVKGGQVIIRNSVIHGFSTAASKGISVDSAAQVTVIDSMIVGNTIGIAASAAEVRVGGSTITANATGVSGSVGSYGNNVLDRNGKDGAFTARTPLK